MKQKKDYEFYLTRFQEVVCFLTAVGIKKHFKTVAEYKKAPNSSKAYCLNTSWNVLQHLSRLPHGYKHFEKFIDASKSLFIYHRHCHKTYKSQKKFSRNSWFELTDETLNKWFENDKNFNTKTCKLISKESHKWIDKHVYKIEKNNNMTKAEKETMKRTPKFDNSDIPEIDDDDIPSKEEILAQKMKTLSYRLQEFHERGFLQASEAERLRRHSIYANELQTIKDCGTSLVDINKHINERMRILNTIANHPSEWDVDFADQKNELGRWCVAVQKTIVANVYKEGEQQ